MDFETWAKSTGKNVSNFKTASLNIRRSKENKKKGETGGRRGTGWGGGLQMQSSIVRLRGMRRGEAKTKSAKNDRAFKEGRGGWEEE